MMLTKDPHSHSRVSGYIAYTNKTEEKGYMPVLSMQSVHNNPSRLGRFVVGTLMLLSIVSFITATTQYMVSYTHSMALSSSEQVDPYFNFRYTTDLADQNDYRDQQSRWRTHDGEWISCGHSPHEAIDRGCVFDIMSAVWLPKPCYNSTFATEVAAIHHADIQPGSLHFSPKTGVSMRNFTWHADESLSPESYIPLNRLENFFLDKYDRGERLIAYSIENFHVAHCMYMMRTALRGLERVTSGEKDVYVHEEAMSEGHAQHCQNVLMNYEKWKTGVVSLEFGMGWCQKVS